MAEIVMPRLSDTMEEGTILRWLKRDGERVARGEPLVEIETDKASMTYDSDQEGVLTIQAPEGETLPVGAPIAQVGERADTAQASASGAAERGEGVYGPARGGPAGSTELAGSAPADVSEERGPAPGERVKASPLARRIAGESGIDLRALTGSGPGGRIVKADVLAPAAAARGAQVEQGAQADGEGGGSPVDVSRAKGETTVVELSRTQQTIARRMAESRATIPDFTLHVEVDMEECVGLRAQLRALSHEEPAARAPRPGETLKAPTYNDMVVKAAALALREHPTANGSYRDGRLQLHSRVNVGVAVAAENALVVPTVFDADAKALGEVARETQALAERVREGTITPPELSGGTFTVSNLGMHGVRGFSAIINPPQVAILSVGAMEPRAVVREGEVLARNTLTLTLACDHRVLYGAEAARFLARIRELLETPSALTL